MHVVYRIAADSRDIAGRAEALAIEQSVEMPPAAIRDARVRDMVLGRVADIAADGPGHFIVTIELALETTGFEAGQLMNMLFGNSALHPDVTVVDVRFPPGEAERFGGPRFGIEGMRRLTGAKSRAMTCTALKPQGSSVSDLAALAGRFAAAGIDIIKDDHGLADQASAPFAARVEAVQAAVVKANRESGNKAIYAPSLNGGPARLLSQLETARQAGVGAVLIAPMNSGMGALQELAGRGLPVIAHPALAGVARIAPPLLLGKLFRLAGADAVIFPNHGGRFSFSPALCRSIAEAARASWGKVASALPVPAGGLQPGRIAELLDFYGSDVMLLMGGALLEANDIDRASRSFVEAVAAHGNAR